MVKDQPADNPRKRGRPRSTDKQQSIERRRTQLRLAQQAYRKRKENSITSLQDRVNQLESGIAEFSHSFLAFSNLLLETGLLDRHTHVTQALQRTTEQCVTLAKLGCDDFEAHKTPTVPTRDNEETMPTNDAQRNQQDIVPDMICESKKSSRTETSLILPTIFPWPAESVPPSPLWQEQGILSLETKSSMPKHTLFDSRVLSPLLPPSPSPISSKSLTEERWTFPQRLVRACFKMGYRLLVTFPTVDVPKIREIFGPGVTILDRNRFISAFYDCIQDVTGIDADMRATVLNSLQLENVHYRLPLSTEADNELFDAYGVQRFLQERGITIQGNVSAVQVPDLANSSSDLVSLGQRHFDVTAFINYLSPDCICVGQGPAFRRQKVEDALRFATLYHVCLNTCHEE